MKATKAGAFSLPELLAFLAILSVLILLALPVVAIVRERGQSAQCVSNLRQLGMALIAYGNDHGGKIPARVEADPKKPGGYLANTYWHQVLRSGGYLGAADVKRRSVHYCLSIPYSGSNDESYGMRRWCSPGQPMDVSQNLRVLTEPADFFLLVDSYLTSSHTQGYFVSGGSLSWRIRLGHGNRANTLFADGHVAAMDRAYFDLVPQRQAQFSTNKQPFYYWPETSQ